MKFNSLNEAHINHFRTIVASDRFSAGESVLDLHAKDQSSHPPHRPEAVIWPMSPVEVAEILKYANANLIPTTGWGSGSSLEGNPIPLKGCLVLDFSWMNRNLDIREGDFQADVEPGVQDLFDLRDILADVRSENSLLLFIPNTLQLWQIVGITTLITFLVVMIDTIPKRRL